MLLFAALIGLYGLGAIALSSSGYRLTGADAERTAQVIGSIGIASLLLHFYVDSSIWKVRSKEVRKALAIQDAVPISPTAEPGEGSSHWRGALHALAYFGIPALAIALLGARGRTVPPQRERTAIAHEAELFPRSAMARYARGGAAFESGDFLTARAELAAAVGLAPSLAPSFAGPAKLLAELDRREGRIDQEIEHAYSAVRADPKDAETRYFLASRLAAERRLGKAEAEYREVIRLRPKFAGGHEGVGVIFKWRGELDQAIPHFRKAAALDPNYPAAWCDLAGALATLGRTQDALDTLANYRRRHPEDRVAADLERAIRAESSSQATPDQQLKPQSGKWRPDPTRITSTRRR
jgi:tetratricopeptide (TPR) repeat protein